MLQVNSATVVKKGVAILRDIHFELSAGDVLCIVGPNGAGKTTLINALVGDIVLSSGAILFNQNNVNELSPHSRAKQIAVLPQFSALNFPFSVSQVVALGRTPHNTGLAIDDHIVNQAMQALDILHLKHRIYTELSGGEKQRTQIARVMAQIWREEDAGTRLLMLDEPTSALDLGHKQQLMEAISEFAKRGVAVVMVEHDLNIALRYADSILVLNHGEMAAYGQPKQAITEPLIAKVFNAQAELLMSTNSGKAVVTL